MQLKTNKNRHAVNDLKRNKNCYASPEVKILKYITDKSQVKGVG